MVLLEMQSSLNVSVAGSLLPLLTGRGMMSLSFLETIGSSGSADERPLKAFGFS
jgi:hypothetical protein